MLKKFINSKVVTKLGGFVALLVGIYLAWDWIYSLFDLFRVVFVGIRDKYFS